MYKQEFVLCFSRSSETYFVAMVSSLCKSIFSSRKHSKTSVCAVSGRVTCKCCTMSVTIATRTSGQDHRKRDWLVLSKTARDTSTCTTLGAFKISANNTHKNQI